MPGIPTEEEAKSYYYGVDDNPPILLAYTSKTLPTPSEKKEVYPVPEAHALCHALAQKGIENSRSRAPNDSGPFSPSLEKRPLRIILQEALKTVQPFCIMPASIGPSKPVPYSPRHEHKSRFVPAPYPVILWVGVKPELAITPEAALEAAMACKKALNEYFEEEWAEKDEPTKWKEINVEICETSLAHLPPLWDARNCPEAL